jgi:hypothetical protein
MVRVPNHIAATLFLWIQTVIEWRLDLLEMMEMARTLAMYECTLGMVALGVNWEVISMEKP